MNITLCLFNEPEHNYYDRYFCKRSVMKSFTPSGLHFNKYSEVISFYLENKFHWFVMKNIPIIFKSFADIAVPISKEICIVVSSGKYSCIVKKKLFHVEPP